MFTGGLVGFGFEFLQAPVKQGILYELRTDRVAKVICLLN
jgi:hypothetical protein